MTRLRNRNEAWPLLHRVVLSVAGIGRGGLGAAGLGLDGSTELTGEPILCRLCGKVG